MHGPTMGDVGGVFAGVVALLVAVGHGLRWLLGWEDRRDSTRSTKLDAWQRELLDREKRIEVQEREYRRNVEQRLSAVSKLATAMHKELTALRSGYQLIATALRSIDPDNRALGLADELLRSAFPPDAETPADMLGLLEDIKPSNERKGSKDANSAKH